MSVPAESGLRRPRRLRTDPRLRTSARPLTAPRTPAPSGEPTSIYLHPDVRGQGRGRQLTTFALDLLREAGDTVATLRVLPGNVRAARMYEATGWRPDGATKDAFVAGATVREVRYRTTR